ncbi:hypothetical protein [Kitasatospora sp. CB01950]|uniref:hypothetical protein n=1 Tax=Kitasatospora sp. CB01950 TaxID=1703930 RepID=UPI00093BB74E|nr:hypothetical protein [Kitasatospora sp. CB01950]OKJ13840.1 hypothetical protein AMK19_10635 [Kitasatospora sp. CB01950]
MAGSGDRIWVRGHFRRRAGAGAGSARRWGLGTVVAIGVVLLFLNSTVDGAKPPQPAPTVTVTPADQR